MEMKVTRYYCNDPYCMDVDDDGKYVRFEDYEELLKDYNMLVQYCTEHLIQCQCKGKCTCGLEELINKWK